MGIAHGCLSHVWGTAMVFTGRVSVNDTVHEHVSALEHIMGIKDKMSMHLVLFDEQH